MIRTVLVLAALSLPAAAPAQEAALGWALGPAVEGLDRDGDGLFSQEEIGGTRLPEGFDLDGDGMWSVVELSQGFFALHDADDNGMLDASELEAMRGFARAGVYRLDL